MVRNKGFKAKVATAIVLSGVAISALFYKPPKHDEIRPAPTAQPCQEQPVCEAPPKCGDGVCEIDKGEAQPGSKNFCEADCGYCGDNIRQIKADKGSKQFADKGSKPFVGEDGNATQYVTERPSETADDCPADFFCGNGSTDTKGVFDGWVAPKNPGEPWKFDKVTVTKSCKPDDVDYCPADCLKNNNKKRYSYKDVPPGITEDPELISNCPPLVISPEYSGTARGVETDIRKTLDKKTKEIRTALQTTPTSDVLVTFWMVVSPTGTLSLQNTTYTCDGSRCKGTSDFALEINNREITPPRATCNWTVTKRLKKVE